MSLAAVSLYTLDLIESQPHLDTLRVGGEIYGTTFVGVEIATLRADFLP